MLEANVDAGLETAGLSQSLELALEYRLFHGVPSSLAGAGPKESNGFSSQRICPEAVKTVPRSTLTKNQHQRFLGLAAPCF